MNNNGIILSPDKMKQIVNNIEKSSDEINIIFENINNIMEDINENDVWKGKTQKLFYERYKELEKNFPEINKGLKNYINFLDITINNYKNTESKLSTSINNNLENLDVN